MKIHHINLPKSIIFRIAGCILAAGTHTASASAWTAPKTVLASVSILGDVGDDWSFGPSISADGRFVAFQSAANNLVMGDFNGVKDVFVRDLTKGLTRRVSVNSKGVEGNGNSGIYSTDGPSISADGRFVVFDSDANNLVAGDNNGTSDVFVHDLTKGVTRRVSVSSMGKEGNEASLYSSISANGRFVAFQSAANNLVVGDNNNGNGSTSEIFVRDLTTGVTQLVSLSSAGTESNNAGSYKPNISGDGRFVAFQSAANNLVVGDNNNSNDIFVRNLTTGVTRRVSVSSMGTEGNNWSFNASISGDGRFVAFDSEADNLVAGDNNSTWDVFVHDLTKGVTRRVSVNSSGAEGNSFSEDPSISADGRFVAFRSDAYNLVAGDNNFRQDVFVRDLANYGVIKLVSVNEKSNSSSGASPSLSADGRFVAFSSLIDNYATNHFNYEWNVFVSRQWDNHDHGDK
jgi:WD40-like Beta Propeller Repeat